MKHKMAKTPLLALALLGGALLTGCASQNSLYQWESYQPQVYQHFKGAAAEEQVTALERDLQKIRASGKTPPPGYHAHLGMLYASLGKGDQMAQEFQTEKQLFPESAAYMDFLLKKAKK